MKLLLPLGLLGLLAIIILIIIYILKPNYQQKLISSTFIWRLSLKFKKRKIPYSRLRNILLIICQLAVISIAAFILSNPVRILKEKIEQPEVVLIIDSSASMRAENLEDSRYERAVNKAIEEAHRAFDRDGIVSVITAGEKNTYLVERAGSLSKEEVYEKMQALVYDENDDLKCSYGTSDLESAVALTDQVLQINPSAKIYIYSDTTYASVPSTIEFVNVSDVDEWNAAIVDARAELEDNYYAFYVDVVCYGRDMDLDVKLEVFGHNAESSEDTSHGTLTLEETVPCTADMVTTLIFKYVPSEEYDAYVNSLSDNMLLHNIDDDNSAVYSYQSIHISIDEDDSIALDNQFDIYGGLKQLIKVQYYSIGTDPNTGNTVGPNVFFQEILASIKKTYADRWDVQIDEVKQGEPYEPSGYDFYIFEHTMPSEMPTDGVVFLVDPMGIPSNFGVRYDKVITMSNTNSVYLAEEESHPILNGMTPSNISVSSYVRLSYYDPAYSVLLSYAGDPMLLVRNDEFARVAILSFSLHYSNLALLIDFPIMIDHIFHYYLPATVVGNSFNINESVLIDCQGNELSVTGYNTNMSFIRTSAAGTATNDKGQTATDFPTTVSFSVPGSYTLSQTTYAGKALTEKIYVRMPASESNIKATGDSITSPYYEVDESDYYSDLLLYLAIALVVFITAEWYLQHRESSI